MGKIYYHGQKTADGSFRTQTIERCTKDQSSGQGVIQWRFIYDSQNRIQYIHNASYDPNSPSDPNSPDNATACYEYTYVDNSIDPVVIYKTRPDISCPTWTQQRNWQLKFDDQNRAVMYQEGCTSGCGASGSFEHIAYDLEFKDEIAKQYNAAGKQILENTFYAVDYSKYVEAGTITIPNGDFEVPSVASDCQSGDPVFWDNVGSLSISTCRESNNQYAKFTDDDVSSYYQLLFPIMGDTYYSVAVDIRGHAFPMGKMGCVKLWADGDTQELLSSKTIGDTDLPDSNWHSFTIDWDSASRPQYAFHGDPSPYFFKIVLKGKKIDMDNAVMATSIKVGNVSKPFIKTQQQLDPMSGDLVTILTRDFDESNYRVTERQYVSNNACSVVKYQYTDKTFANVASNNQKYIEIYEGVFRGVDCEAEIRPAGGGGNNKIKGKNAKSKKEN